MGICGLGVMNYQSWLEKIDPYEINGGEYLPEFKINYNSFKDEMYKSCFICGIMFILSFLTAGCKKPFYSFLYTTVGFFACLYVLLASLKCYDFNRVAELEQIKLCRNSTRPEEI